MTRDEIEEWVEKHIPDAVERLPDGSRSVARWVKALAQNLIDIAKEEAEEPEDDDIVPDDLDDDDLDDDEDDPEDEVEE